MNRWLPFEWIAAVRFLREGRMQTAFIIARAGGNRHLRPVQIAT